jgi:hypothetical protein
MAGKRLFEIARNGRRNFPGNMPTSEEKLDKQGIQRGEPAAGEKPM